jgi:DNA-directed RNA polymerase specialized sigma24 family protein
MRRSADQQLLSMVSAGHVDGLGGLFDRHGQRCLRTAKRLTGDNRVAEEVVFETFIAFWRDPPREGQQSLRQLLTRQTAHLATRERFARSAAVRASFSSDNPRLGVVRPPP